MLRPALVPYVDPSADDDEAPTLPGKAKGPIPNAPADPYVRKISGTRPVVRAKVAQTRLPTFFGPSPDCKTVVVVDDDDACRALLVRALALKYTVYEARDGVDALQLLACIDPPDAILADVAMPQLDGLELAKRVRAQPTLRRTSLIFLTARVAPTDVIAGINAGARVYVTKPFAMKDLFDKLAKVIR